MDQQIQIPPPEEIRRRIESRRAEIAALKTALKLSSAATTAQHLSTIHNTQAGEQTEGPSGQN